MLNILKYIDYAFKAKKGHNAPEELVSETSFGLIEGFFIISFIILGLITGVLGFVAFYYMSNIALVFAILFLFALSIDIFVYIKVKKFFNRMSKKVVEFTKEKYKTFQSDNIVDVEYENSENKKLYIIATPIGNLEDITYRAVRTLSEVDIILCEDTRVTGKLLARYEISARLESYHAHSNASKEKKILDNIDAGITYGLVSDAGTPTISDPGVKLIHEVYKRFGTEVDVISLPGATALITALSSSGFMGNQFCFYGFLPHKKGRNTIFSEIFKSNKISLFYESPHRIMKTLKFLHENYFESERKICIARELTKMYEQKIISDISTVYKYFLDHPDKVKGEFVVVIDKA